jgi:hypothetical protein
MEKKLISQEKGTQQRIAMDTARKRKAWSDAIEYVSEFVKVETPQDKEELSRGLKKYVIRHLRERFKDFEDLMSDEKILDFANVSLSILNEIQSKLAQYPQIKFNSDYTDFIIPDVGLYAASENEIRRYNLSERFIQLVDELRKEGHTIHWNNLAMAVSGAVKSTGASLTHSAQFIKRR